MGYVHMEYGHFIGNGEIYKINEIKTPTPWKNNLFNDEYFTEVSQRLCGKSFAVENWDRSPVLDEQKLFYIKIGDKVYQPGSGKSKKYFCEHHIYKSVMTDEFDEFISKITVFVPTAGKREMWNIEIQNKTENDIEAQIFAYFEFANIEYLSLECDHINGYFCKKSFPYHVHYEEYAKLKNK